MNGQKEARQDAGQIEQVGNAAAVRLALTDPCEELGHLHLNGSIHLATGAALGEAQLAERLAQPGLYQPSWGEEQVRRVGPDAAIIFFRRNYEDLQTRASDAYDVEVSGPFGRSTSARR
jgi:hypothetical protein